MALDQVNLRQRVVHGAGRLVELNRAAHRQGAVERFLRPAEVAEPHADLPERRERHGEAVIRSVRFVDRHAAFRQHQRLLVAVLERQDVRLVAAGGRQHVIGLHAGGEALGVAERAHRLLVASELRQRDARQRVDQREVTAIAGRVECRRGLREVFAHDRGVADLAVALGELEVGEADGARVVCALGVLQGAPVQGDGARLFAARVREPAVQAPERGQAGGRHAVAEGVGCPAEHRRRLVDIVLQQPGFRQRGTHGELVFPREHRRAQQRREDLDGLGAAAPLERGACTREKGMQSG